MRARHPCSSCYCKAALEWEESEEGHCSLLKITDRKQYIRRRERDREIEKRLQKGRKENLKGYKRRRKKGKDERDSITIGLFQFFLKTCVKKNSFRLESGSVELWTLIQISETLSYTSTSLSWHMELRLILARVEIGSQSGLTGNEIQKSNWLQEEQEKVIKKCKQYEPRHGELWTRLDLLFSIHWLYLLYISKGEINWLYKETKDDKLPGIPKMWQTGGFLLKKYSRKEHSIFKYQLKFESWENVQLTIQTVLHF